MRLPNSRGVGRLRSWLLLAVQLCVPCSVLSAAARAASTASPLSYRFHLERAPELRIWIRLETAGNDASTTTFEVSREWGGVSAGGEDLAAVRAQDASGTALAVEHPEPHRWRVLHAPGAKLAVEWSIASNAHQDDPSPNVHRRPILNEHLFHAYGDLALLWPAHLDERTRRPVRFEWSGFDDAGWKVASSFGVGPEPIDLQASLVELRSAVYMAGHLDLVRRDVEGRPVWVARQGDSWSFTTDEFADLAARIVRLERGFFAEWDVPFFLITAIPVGESDPRSTSIGGTGLTNSFSLAMRPSTPLHAPFGRSKGIAGLLAHEMFHQWCGHTIVPADPEQLCYWFTEGFTDFYTRRLLFRGGLASLDEYAQSLNAALADLWASPVATAPNERIRADFWRDDDVKRLPYLRGDILALVLDHEISKTSEGDQSLDDLMRSLVRDARANGERVTVESILHRIEDLAGHDVAAWVKYVVVDGALPPMPLAMLRPCLETVIEPVGRFDLGFDFQRARAEGKIVGLVPGSAAARAGLRDGDRIAGWSVHMGDATRPVKLAVQDGDAKRDVEFLPVGATIETPQFHVLPTATADVCDIL